MKILIEKIKVAARIRKEITKIPELAEDIKQNGLLHPVSVMPLESGEFSLLAGLRRLNAARLLGWTEIEGAIVSPADAEAALRIEISENEQREPFTYSEKMDYALLIEEIEQAKARERMLCGKSAESTDPVDYSPQGNSRSRDAIGAKIGMSGRQYDRAKYVAKNAPEEVIAQLDRGERTVQGTYNELRSKSKDATTQEPRLLKTMEEPDTFVLASRSRAAKTDPLLEKLKAEEADVVRRRRDFDALSPDGKIAELQRQLREVHAHAAGAESALAREKELRQNEMCHYTATIDMLKNQLAAAEARIVKLEGEHEPH